MSLQNKAKSPATCGRRRGAAAVPHEAWHEASVGTLAFFDGDGRRLKTIYLGRMPEPHKATLVAQVNAELMAVLAERPEMNVVLASDGAAPHWEALDALATRIAPICTGRTVKLLDAFHAAEYVQLAANAIEGLGTGDAAIRAATWRETLKQRDDGAAVVLRSMRALSPSVRSAARRKELATAIAYIANRAKLGRMRYADALAHHFPVGTGITEAAAKTVVGTRMKRAGARLSQHGGQTVMLFRTAILSGRFDALHTRLTATYAAAVKFAA